ncbi:methyltransferase domain-containing protein [Pullulanibacillus sp. KACC 23026]|uniref:class I SAM-dependent methyltransferase n=1 Tax=Pullulanibacillus sp. KACC 23026 TaxID=3028315 RepID=UPI0023B1EE97|nr:class I SAM-dependent methyltransferase [Pullulanibacillus sp. KACC 23026]WEG10912.1 methyltransferase domain-containing protein [Pullulanibacillus sp. KACC 23026]
MANKEVDDWNAKLYDDKHAFVSKYGKAIIQLLAPKQGEQILDLGCGTGDLAYNLYEQGVTIIGVDKSEKMIQQAQLKYPSIKFIVRDVLDLTYSNTFDAVFSNATLHWVKQPQQALRALYSSLKPGGRFVAEFGGKGNVKTITDEIIRQIHQLEIPYSPENFPWYFPSIGEYTSLMEEAGFSVVYAEWIDRPTPLDGDNGLRNWISQFSSSLLDSTTELVKEELITRVETTLKGTLYQNGKWVADYKRLRVTGYKN